MIFAIVYISTYNATCRYNQFKDSDRHGCVLKTWTCCMKKKFSNEWIMF